jgi:hypothetical protein
MERILASERTRERLKALMNGEFESADGRSELMRLTARLIIEEALEGEARDTLGRDYYAGGAAPGMGYGTFNYVTISAPIIARRRRSVSRDMLRHMTVLPGGGSLARAR